MEDNKKDFKKEQNANAENGAKGEGHGGRRRRNRHHRGGHGNGGNNGNNAGNVNNANAQNAHKYTFLFLIIRILFLINFVKKLKAPYFIFNREIIFNFMLDIISLIFTLKKIKKISL